MKPLPVPLRPRPDPPQRSHIWKIPMLVGRNRYELAIRIEMREITRGPAEIIEMPATAGNAE